MILALPGINRFCVMATFQAARAYLLGLKMDEAYSWGLNRSIFYAAAKRGFKGAPQKGVGHIGKGEKEKEASGLFRLGDEIAFESPSKKGSVRLFTIGGKTQTPEDFKKQVSSRFGRIFEKAWEDALSLLRKENKSTLLSQKRFYEEVYKPNRDIFVERWAKMVVEEK